MELFDTHFHYYSEDGTPEDYYKHIRTPELALLLAVGAGWEESLSAKEFAETLDSCWFAAGVHPHGAEDFLNNNVDFTPLFQHRKLVAVGEIGLDFYYEHSKREQQIRVLEFFLQAALQWHKPAIIHCRDRDGSQSAYQECYALLRQFSADGGRFVVHSYTGTPEWLERFLELGAYIGVNGIVTFPKAENVREVAKLVPESRLLLETDAPYLAPVPFRGKRNHPGLLIHIAEYLAALRGMATEQLAALTTANGRKFFLEA